MSTKLPLKERFKVLARKIVNKLPTQPKVVARLNEIQTLESEVRYIQTEGQNLHTAYAQLQDVIKQMGGLIPPPPHLQVRVAGGYVHNFIQTGELVVNNLNGMLAPGNKDLRSFETILDFGCGCARMLRALHYHATPSQKLYGTELTLKLSSGVKQITHRSQSLASILQCRR